MKKRCILVVFSAYWNCIVANYVTIKSLDPVANRTDRFPFTKEI